MSSLRSGSMSWGLNDLEEECPQGRDRSVPRPPGGTECNIFSGIEKRPAWLEGRYREPVGLINLDQSLGFYSECNWEPLESIKQD